MRSTSMRVAAGTRALVRVTWPAVGAELMKSPAPIGAATWRPRRGISAPTRFERRLRARLPPLRPWQPDRLAQWAKTDILVMDDLAMAPLADAARRDLLEVLDDRHALRSTIITSQIPVESWHAAIGDPTLADAILDRLVHNAHRLTLSGESMRKRRMCLTDKQESE
jgi:hypothetical protein